MPFKLNTDRRHHIPKQKFKVTNWHDYDASLRQRGSLTVWVTDEAIALVDSTGLKLCGAGEWLHARQNRDGHVAVQTGDR